LRQPIDGPLAEEEPFASTTGLDSAYPPQFVKPPR